MSNRGVLLVFAGDYREFKYFIKNTPTHLQEDLDIRFMSKPGDERGFGYEVAFMTYGTWYKNEWMHEVIRRFRERSVSNKVFKYY